MSPNLTSTIEALHYSEPRPASGQLGGVVKAESAFSRGEVTTHSGPGQLVRLSLASDQCEAPEELAGEQLRARFVETDATADRSADLAAIWRRLLAGELAIEDSFHERARCYMVLRKRARLRDEFSPRKLSVLEHVLIGGRHKTTTHQLQISASTVSMVARQALSFLGLECTPSKVPLLLCVLAHAGRPGAPRREARVSFVRTSRGELTVLSIARPDFALRPRLSQGEFAVLSGLVEGRSHKQIAVERGASAHTVANQLTSAFRRLGVSGRLELLQALAAPIQAFPMRDPEPEPVSSPRAACAPSGEEFAAELQTGNRRG